MPPAGRTSIRATRSPGIAVLSQEVPDGGAVPEPDVASAFLVVDRQRRVVPDPGSGSDRANEVVDLLAGGPGSDEPRPRCSSNAPTRSTTSRRRKIVYEIARFQRLWSFKDRRIALPGRRRLAAAVDAAPGHAVELGLAGEEAADVPEHVLLVGAVVVRETRPRPLRRARGRHCGHVRARERSARGRPPGRWSRAPVGETRPGSDRRRSRESPCASGTRGT